VQGKGGGDAQLARKKTQPPATFLDTW
jgi:hypothetical protein